MLIRHGLFDAISTERSPFAESPRTDPERLCLGNREFGSFDCRIEISAFRLSHSERIKYKWISSTSENSPPPFRASKRVPVGEPDHPAKLPGESRGSE
jgi:hypothetical protein